jgi:membrane protease subunit HflK
VPSDKRAVVRRFGRILPHKPQPGLHIGWPWGIDRVDLAPVGKERIITVGFNDKEDRDDEVVPAGQLLTGDHNLVNVQVSINYRVREKDMENFVLQQDAVDGFVARAAESLIAEWVAGRKIDDITRRGKSELPRFLLEHLQERIEPYGLGIAIEQASVPRVEPPDQVKDAFEKVARAQTNITTQVNQARQSAESREREAEGERKRMKTLAEAYADNEIKLARSDAANFLERARQFQALSRDNPGYINTLWLDTMTRLYARMKSEGRIQPLDHYLSDGGLTITEFPLPRKK